MPKYTATGIIEGMAIRRRKEEASRLHLTISIPIPDNQQLLLYAAANQGNAIDFSLEAMQGALFAAAGVEAPAGNIDTSEAADIFTDPDEEDELEEDPGHPVPPEPVYSSEESPLVDSLLQGAQDDAQMTEAGGDIRPVEQEDRAQAMANLSSASEQQNGHSPRRGRRIGLPDPEPVQ